MSRLVIGAIVVGGGFLTLVVWACLRAAAIADDIMEDLRRADRWS